MTRRQDPEFTIKVHRGLHERKGEYIIECTQYGYNWSTIKLINKEQVHILIRLLQDALEGDK